MLILDIRFSFGFSSAPLIPASHKGHRWFVSGRVNLKSIVLYHRGLGEGKGKKFYESESSMSFMG
jgi:hypothetical protein